MNNPRRYLVRAVAAVAFVVSLTGCGLVGDFLFPPISGTFQDALVEFSHCGSPQVARVGVRAVPYAQDDSLTQFMVTVSSSSFRETQRFEWVGKHPGAHIDIYGNTVTVNIDGQTASGSASFDAPCLEGESDSRVDVVFAAERIGI